MDTDRRDRRSYNLHEALELQLAATAKKGKFSAVVLTENQGITVAGAGNMAEIEEIAAFAPQLAPGKRYWQGSLKDVGGEDKLVTVAPIESEMGKLYMCAVGGESQKIIAELLLGSRGVNRILA